MWKYVVALLYEDYSLHLCCQHFSALKTCNLSVKNGKYYSHRGCICSPGKTPKSTIKNNSVYWIAALRKLRATTKFSTFHLWMIQTLGNFRISEFQGSVPKILGGLLLLFIYLFYLNCMCKCNYIMGIHCTVHKGGILTGQCCFQDLYYCLVSSPALVV